MVSTRTAYPPAFVFETDSLVGEKAVVQSTEGRRGLGDALVDFHVSSDLRELWMTLPR